MLARCVPLDGLKEYLRSVRPTRRIDRVIVHHFWQPDAKQWRGLPTLLGVRDYHVKARGFRDIAYHIIIGPDSTIWLGRPLEQAGGHCAGQNSRSVGLAWAANFDVGHDDPAKCGYELGAQVAAAVCQRFGMDEDDVFFHRDFANKSCPGTALSREHFRNRVTAYMEGSDARGPAEPQYVRLKIDDKLVIGAQVRMEPPGTAYGLEGPVARALGEEAQVAERLVPVRAYLAEHGIIIPPEGWHPEQGPAGTIYAYSTHDG